MTSTDIPMNLTEADFINYVARGAARLTAREVHALIAEMPDIREQFSRLRGTSHADTERQLWFLSEVVEQVWTHEHLDMPYGAALEAAFAITYFVRETDLIPDALGAVGFIDDIAVVQTVFARNADAFGAFRDATKLDWANFKISPRHLRNTSAS